MTYIVGIYGTYDTRLPGEMLKGTGKTLTMIYYGYQDFLMGRKVYANIKTAFTDEMSTQDVYEMFKDKDVRNVTILLDEIQKDLNSLPGSTDTALLKQFVNVASAQTRKKGVSLWFTTQRFWDIPLRLRTQTDIMLQPMRIHADRRACTSFSCDRAHYIAVYSREPFKPRPLVYLDAESVGRLYDTNQIIMDEMKEGVKS